MDPLFDAQYRDMKDSFSRARVQIDVAYTRDDQVDYIYVVDRLLAVDIDDNVARLEDILPGLHRADPDEQPRIGDLVVLSTDDLAGGYRTVPEALDFIDERLGDENPALAEGGEPLATPIHIMHTARLCTPKEPDVPSGSPTTPSPTPTTPRLARAAGDEAGGEASGEAGNGASVFVSDTGLVPPDNDRHPWLAGVTGDPDRLGAILPSGLPDIPEHAGHGTFVAGVVRSMAPRAAVHVSNDFRLSGGATETYVVRSLDRFVEEQSPDVINISAGTYTRKDLPPLSFSQFYRRHPDVVLVAAAGNDGLTRKFFPGGSDETIAVGSIGADLEHAAWFTNYGEWVNVYAPGEGLVNAYATGVYTYREPPKRPAKQTFNGMAQWDGTSFSAAMVAGMIAAHLSRTDDPLDVATRAVLGNARVIPGVGPVLLP